MSIQQPRNGSWQNLFLAAVLESQGLFTTALDDTSNNSTLDRVPLALNLAPFFLGEQVGVGRNPVVLAHAHQVFGVVDACQVPVRAEKGQCFKGGVRRGAGPRDDGEVGVPEKIAPLIMLDEIGHWRRGLARRRDRYG